MLKPRWNGLAAHAPERTGVGAQRNIGKMALKDDGAKTPHLEMDRAPKISEEKMADTESQWRLPGRLKAVLILNGVLKSLKFGEPFLSRFLETHHGLSQDAINNSVYPFLTYAHFAFLVPVTLLSGRLGYRTLVWVEAACEILTYAMLIWAKGLWMMQLMQVVYGLSCAASIGYYISVSYLMPLREAPRWTVYLKAATLAGHLAGSLSAQALREWANVPLLCLYYLTFGSLVLAALLLPMLPARYPRPSKRLASLESTIIEEKTVEDKELIKEPATLSCWQSGVRAWQVTFSQNTMLMLTSLGWVIFYCFLMLSEAMGTSLWEHLAKRHGRSEKEALNGVLDAVARGSAALAVFLVGVAPCAAFAKSGASISAPLWLILGCCITAILTYASVLESLSYLTAASAWMASIAAGHAILALFGRLINAGCSSALYGFVFGTQTFLAMLLQTVYQLVVSESGLGLDTTKRYVTYAVGLAAAALPPLFVLLWTLLKLKARDHDCI